MAKHKTNPYEDGDDARFVAASPKRTKRKRVSASKTKLIIGPKDRVVKRTVKRTVAK